MARGVNKVILIGTLGRDPETKYMPSGGAITRVNLATNEQWTDKSTGSKQERTEWHRVVFFNRLAEIAGQYLRKGQQVYIEGSLRTNKWQGQDGQDRYTTEIIADQMQMLGGRSEGDSAGSGNFSAPSQSNDGGGGYDDANSNSSSNNRPAAPSKSAKPANQGSNQPADRGFEDFDDDIPF